MQTYLAKKFSHTFECISYTTSTRAERKERERKSKEKEEGEGQTEKGKRKGRKRKKRERKGRKRKGEREGKRNMIEMREFNANYRALFV